MGRKKSRRERVDEFLEQLSRPPSALPSFSHALAATLNPSELFRLLETTWSDDLHARDVVLNAVEKHPNPDAIMPLASRFVRQLAAQVSDRATHARTRNHVIDRLFDWCDAPTQEAVVDCWLNDKYADSKHRLIKRLAGKGDFGGHNRIYEFWLNQADETAAKHLIYDAPLDWLYERRAAFVQADLPPWLRSRLLLRLADVNPLIVEPEKDRDPINYLYLRAKLASPLSIDEAVELFQKSLDDTERRGLAIWAIGRMGLWDALMIIREMDEAVAARDLTAFEARYRIGA